MWKRSHVARKPISRYDIVCQQQRCLCFRAIRPAIFAKIHFLDNIITQLDTTPPPSPRFSIVYADGILCYLVVTSKTGSRRLPNSPVVCFLLVNIKIGISMIFLIAETMTLRRQYVPILRGRLCVRDFRLTVWLEFAL